MVPSGHEIDGFLLVSVRWVMELSAKSMHSMTPWHVFRGQESPYSDTPKLHKKGLHQQCTPLTIISNQVGRRRVTVRVRVRVGGDSSHTPSKYLTVVPQFNWETEQAYQVFIGCGSDQYSKSVCNLHWTKAGWTNRHKVSVTERAVSNGKQIHDRAESLRRKQTFERQTFAELLQRYI